MAVAYGSISTAKLVDGGDITITKPSGLSVGDFMLAFIFVNGAAGAPIELTGWTEVEYDNEGTNRDMAVLCKVADSSDVSATDFTFQTSSGAGDNVLGAIMRITGSSFSGSGNIVASVIEQDADADDDKIAEFENGITPQANCFMVMAIGCSVSFGGDNVITSYAVTNDDPTWTERADFGESTNPDCVMGIATATRTQETATGAYSITFNAGAISSFGDGFGILLAIQESTSQTVTGSTGILTLTGNAGTVNASANITGNTGILTLTGNAGTFSSPAPDWRNTDKSSAPPWVNPDKS